MTSLIRHTYPVRQTYPLSNLVGRFFDDGFFGAPARWTENDVAERPWVPAVDLSETEDGFVIKADLPGATREDIHLSVEDGTLTLTGERSFEKKEEGETFNRIERSFGKFSRSFSLPSNVDTSAVKATFNDGVLSVDIPKTEQTKLRQVKIS